MFTLTGELSVPRAKAMDDFPDPYSHHLNLATPSPRSTLKEAMNHLYSLSTDLLQFPDEDKKRALLKKINATRNLWQKDSTFSSYAQSLQFLEQNVVYGERSKTTLTDPLYIPESDNVHNPCEIPLISHNEKKISGKPTKPISCLTFKGGKVIPALENHLEPHETNLEEKITRKLSPESLEIIRPLFELYGNLHQDHIFRSFKNKVFKIYRDIPQRLYPELEELLEKLTMMLRNVQSFPDNQELKVKLASRKQSLRKFYKSHRSQEPISLDIHRSNFLSQTERRSQRKRPRTEGEDISSSQKKPRMADSERTIN